MDRQIAAEPDKAAHYYNRGDTLRRLHRDDEALASYLQARHVSLESGDEDIADAVDHFVWPSRDNPTKYVFVSDGWWENLRRSDVVPGELCRYPGCTRQRITLTIYCPWHHYEIIQGRPCPYGDDD